MSWFDSRPWRSSYATGVPAEIAEVTDSLVEMLENSARQYGKRIALEFFGRDTSYGQLLDQVSRAAEGLRGLGVKAGDRVALVMPNSPQHVVAFYAALRLGAIVVEHNPLYTPPELRHQFEDHGAAVAIVWDKVAATVLAFPPDVRPSAVVSVDITRGMPLRTRIALRLPIERARSSRAALTSRQIARGALPWSRLLGSRAISGQHPRPKLADTAVLQYTSGTTGNPKGAILTHRNLRANAMQGAAWLPGL